MKIGFTGTQVGLTAPQREKLRAVLAARSGELHHGDCIGADAEAHAIAAELGYRIHIHPPESGGKRAWCTGHSSEPPQHYLDRNRAIVDAADALIATPKGPEELRSGTWSTIRYARSRRRPIYVIWPDGRGQALTAA
jgi:hypothetical protein